MFDEAPFSQYLTSIDRKATQEDILAAHTKSYFALLEESVPDEGYMPIGHEAILNPYSLNAALLASGTMLQAVDDVKTGNTDRVFCALRPPGHHAESHRGMGFCLLNHIFIAALYAKKQGFKKIALLDFDVHHGNGTDEMMKRHGPEDMLFISTHEFPLYPGTGGPNTDIPGSVKNICLPKHSGSKEMRKIYTEDIFPELEEFSPDLVLLSAGFDAHKSDPLATLGWTEEDYNWLGEKFSHYKAIACLEGGYQLEALKSSVEAFLRGFFNIQP